MDVIGAFVGMLSSIIQQSECQAWNYFKLEYNLIVSGISTVDVRSCLGKEFLRILLKTHVATADELSWSITVHR